MMKYLQFFLLFIIITSAMSVAFSAEPVAAAPVEQPTFSAGENSILNMRAGFGVSVYPNTFAFMGNIEYRVDEHFAFGPMMQMGLSAETKFYMPTLGGRFIVPNSFWKKSLGANIETSLFAGLGQNFRQVQGFRFNDFVYQFGLNLDAIVFQGFTLGLATTFNLTDNSVDGFFPAVYGSLGYQF